MRHRITCLSHIPCCFVNAHSARLGPLVLVGLYVCRGEAVGRSLGEDGSAVGGKGREGLLRSLGSRIHGRKADRQQAGERKGQGVLDIEYR